MSGKGVDVPDERRGDSPVVSEILRALPSDGSTIGDGRLRDQVGLDADLYREVIGALKRLGYVIAGRGRGGFVGLTDTGRTSPGSTAIQ